MSEDDTGAGITCPIDLFPIQEAEVQTLTQALNRASTAREKAPHAQALIEAVEVLLACESYDEKNPSCRLCRDFSDLRRRTAEVIVKAAALS